MEMPDLTKFFDTPAREYRIERTHELDLMFDGWLIGQDEISDYTKTRWTRVALYLSNTGTYVAHIMQGGDGLNHIHRACARRTFEETVKWMREDNKGHLGSASKKVVSIAVDRLPWLDGADVERV